MVLKRPGAIPFERGFLIWWLIESNSTKIIPRCRKQGDVMKKKLRINFALEVLRSNIQSIRSVTDWSDMMGWDRAEFSRRYSKLHGESAKAALHRYKLKSIHKELSENPLAKYYVIAHNIGFRDEKAFYDYMRYHTTCSPTEYKKRVLSSGLVIKN